jgi:hypothetical protein
MFYHLYFNAGTGEPAMCAVILKSEKESHTTLVKWCLFQVKSGKRKSNFDITDIIPLVHRAWDGIFANIDNLK